ncbi:hypothetical protein J6O48_01825 [bacterium]|nr:hypothetical protein [bacterium]
MRSHFRDAVEGDIKYTRSRRTMSQTWRADRYNPYKDVQTVRDEAANIFYLIDNSGSMYNNGTDIFIHIFAEIISLEKTCHVGMSARSYFTTYHITPETCETWTSKTPKAKILEKLAKTNGSGGTQIA